MERRANSELDANGPQRLNKTNRLNLKTKRISAVNKKKLITLDTTSPNMISANNAMSMAYSGNVSEQTQKKKRVRQISAHL